MVNTFKFNRDVCHLVTTRRLYHRAVFLKAA